MFKANQGLTECSKMNKSMLAFLAIVIGGLVLASLVTGFNLIAWTPQDNSNSGNSATEGRLLIDGFVEHALNLTMNELMSFPRITIYATLYCVDSPNSPVAKGNWTGVRLQTLTQEAVVSPGASDGFSTDLTLTDAALGDVVVAYSLNGQLLPEAIRLVVPGRWGYKWISKLDHIEFVNYDFKGLWESRGYSDDAAI
jgi:DMSO/TMAO reductase YedYZ molybdopterin-dependent catalytic subunit